MIDERGCPEWLEGVSAYLDGALSQDEEQRVHSHLRGCPGCAELLVDLVPMVQTLRGLPAIEPPRDLWPALSATLRQDQAFKGGTKRADRQAWRRPLMGLMAAGVAVLATGALTVYGYRQSQPVVPVADLNTYWQAHDAFDRDQGLPTRQAPDVGAVEASHDLGP